MIKLSILTGIVAAAFALTACNAEKTGNGATAASNVPIKAVPPPKGGDWTTVVATTPEGGFVMGNPNAKVKLVEYGSMTCPHCREFDEAAMTTLTNKYVKSGQVSFEFRNFVRDGYDMAASVIARCAGTSGFFGLTRQLYADQPDWVAKIQAADPAKMQAIGALPVNQQLTEVAKLADLQQYAAMRGLPVAKSSVCLADDQTPTRLVQIQTDVLAKYPDFPGTPTFIQDGKMVEIKAGESVWSQVEASINAALGS